MKYDAICRQSEFWGPQCGNGTVASPILISGFLTALLPNCEEAGFSLCSNQHSFEANAKKNNKLLLDFKKSSSLGLFVHDRTPFKPVF